MKENSLDLSRSVLEARIPKLQRLERGVRKVGPWAVRNESWERTVFNVEHKLHADATVY